MSNECVSVRRQRSIYRVHYALPRREPDMARPLLAPGRLKAFGLQVAGHRGTADDKFTDLLQCNGTVLKPIFKEPQKREVDFYEHLLTTNDPDLLELREFVPKYYGCKKFTYKGVEQDYIILEDLTQRMLEQCVMDVKIGRRTWDPLATEEKIKREQSKYALCKQQYGFCIPGYLVHRLSDGKLLKYGKDYGKKIHGRMVVETFRNYLNGVCGPLCRALVLTLLSPLWRLQRWARRPRTLRLYSASLLLVYDAARLRECCRRHLARSASQSQGLRRRASFSGPSTGACPGPSFSGQLADKGPVFKKVSSVPTTCMATAQKAFTPPPPVQSSWTEALDLLNTNHSFENNYEKKLSKIKVNYRTLLDDLSSDTPNPNPWCTVKIIDFVHAFLNEDEEPAVDENFREGIDNLVDIFEGFLRETDDDQV